MGAERDAVEVEVDQDEVERVVNTVREVGFCVAPAVIAAGRAGEIRDILMRIVKAEKTRNLRPNGHQRTLHVLTKDPAFIELLCHPFVLAVWRRYLAPDIICSAMTANTLWPKCSEQYWHVDHPYWTLTQPYSVYPLTGQTIWMIDDFTAANGATAGIAGSHRRDTLPTLGAQWTDEATILTGSRGSAIFSDGAWWHTSRPNASRRARCAVLTTYIRTHCVPQEDMRRQLEAIAEPSELARHLLGGNQYQSTKTFPY